MKYLLFALFFFPGVADAAMLSLETGTSALRVGDTAEVTVSLQTEGEIVNALEGALFIPETLSVREVRYTGSVVSLWLEAPAVENGILSFVGVLPGGYQNGEKEETIQGNLFTLVLEATGEGEGVVTFTYKTRIYLNDGEGTARTPALGELALRVEGLGGSAAPLAIDTTPPEPPVLALLSGELFNKSGQVLTFVAQDKDSGVQSYHVARSFFPLPEFLLSFTEAESPASLTSLDTFKIVTVRAKDAQGNQSLASTAPGGLLAAVPSLIVILFGALLFLYRGRLRAIIKK